MNKLPRDDNAEEVTEWTIRQLDEADDDDEMAWVEREPYRRGVLSVFSAFRRLRANIRALALLASEGLLDNLAWAEPPKPKKADPLDGAANYAADDAWRIKALWKANRLRPLPGKVTAAEVAVERHLRISGLRGDKDKLVQKVIRRLDPASGPSRAERAMAKLRAK